VNNRIRGWDQPNVLIFTENIGNDFLNVEKQDVKQDSLVLAESETSHD
jgi:hypothetical protein